MDSANVDLSIQQAFPRIGLLAYDLSGIWKKGNFKRKKGQVSAIQKTFYPLLAFQ